MTKFSSLPSNRQADFSFKADRSVKIRNQLAAVLLNYVIQLYSHYELGNPTVSDFLIDEYSDEHS